MSALKWGAALAAGIGLVVVAAGSKKKGEKAGSCPVYIDIDPGDLSGSRMASTRMPERQRLRLSDPQERRQALTWARRRQDTATIGCITDAYLADPTTVIGFQNQQLCALPDPPIYRQVSIAATPPEGIILTALLNPWCAYILIARADPIPLHWNERLQWKFWLDLLTAVETHVAEIMTATEIQLYRDGLESIRLFIAQKIEASDLSIDLDRTMAPLHTMYRHAAFYWSQSPPPGPITALRGGKSVVITQEMVANELELVSAVTRGAKEMNPPTGFQLMNQTIELMGGERSQAFWARFLQGRIPRLIEYLSGRLN